MSFRATDNLKCYLQEARLPTMRLGPLIPNSRENRDCGHSQVPSARPERYRNLRSIFPFITADLNDYISAWIEEHTPCESLGIPDEDEISGERLTVPCPPFFNIPHLPLGRPSDIERLYMWLDHLPMETVRRTIHLLYPETQKWTYVTDDDSTDYRVLKHLMWTYPSNNKYPRPEVSRHSVSLFVKPPWILATEDLERFTRLPCLTSFDKISDPLHCRFSAEEILWSQVWDTCVVKDCPWFVVSTYTNWVFGVFSEGWTTAFVTPVYNHDDCNPTIIEVLLFWFISAMNLPGGWVVPQVRIEPAFPRRELVCTAYDIARGSAAEALALAAVQ